MKGSLHQRKSRRHHQRPLSFFKFLGLGLLTIFLGNLSFRLAQTFSNNDKPIDAILVLGGSPEREVHAAQLATKYPDIPLLVSKGSAPHCLKEIFKTEGIPLERVWVELFAQSTFDNFYHNSNTLKDWQVRRVKVVTSRSHLPRAEWLGKILLGSQGIAVEMDVQGPIEREPSSKIILDVGRSLLWAGLIQVIGVPKYSANNLDEVTSFAQDKKHCEAMIPGQEQMHKYFLPQ